MNTKRYTDRQALALLTRIIGLPELSGPRARSVLVELLEARLGELVARRSTAQAVRDAPDEQIAKWQRMVGERVTSAADLRSRHIGPAMVFSPVTLTVSATNAIAEVSAPPGAMLTIQAYALLRLVGRNLHHCDSDDCGRLFVRVGKRRYCSPRCQKREYMRRFRAGEAGRE